VKIVDLNVLLYAINIDAEHHAKALQWWENAVNGDETVGLAWVVVLGFLRIVTNPRVFPVPLSTEAAIARIDAWLECPTVKLVVEKNDHWTVLRSLLDASGAAGNLTTDAHLGAFAITHDAVLVSCDADFGRFDGMRWENPLKSN
jgi:toxin-antitoxin system PIN domain toxin